MRLVLSIFESSEADENAVDEKFYYYTVSKRKPAG